MLKYTKKIIFEVDYHDFEKLVNDTYGDGYDLVADQELDNSSCFKFNIPNKHYVRDKNDENSIRKGQYPQYCTHEIISCLINDGILIEEGEYIIHISW